MFRSGMWVKDSNGRVGIFQLARGEAGQPLLDRKPEFHIVDDFGRTMLVVPADTHTLKQARQEDIPVHRRPSGAVAAKFGYA